MAAFEKNWQLFKRFLSFSRFANRRQLHSGGEAKVVSTNVVSETLMTEEFPHCTPVILTPLLNLGKTLQAEKTNRRCVIVLPRASTNGRKPTEVGAGPVVLIGRVAILEHFSAKFSHQSS